MLSKSFVEHYLEDFKPKFLTILINKLFIDVATFLNLFWLNSLERPLTLSTESYAEFKSTISVI